MALDYVQELLIFANSNLHTHESKPDLMAQDPAHIKSNSGIAPIARKSISASDV